MFQRKVVVAVFGLTIPFFSLNVLSQETKSSDWLDNYRENYPKFKVEDSNDYYPAIEESLPKYSPDLGSQNYIQDYNNNFETQQRHLELEQKYIQEFQPKVEVDLDPKYLNNLDNWRK